MKELSIPKPHTYARPVKFEHLEQPDAVSSLRVFQCSSDAIHVQFRKVNGKTVTIAGADVHLEEARILRDRLEQWIRDQENGRRDKSADVDVVVVPQQLLDDVRAHIQKDQVDGVTFEECAGLLERIREARP